MVKSERKSDDRRTKMVENGKEHIAVRRPGEGSVPADIDRT